MLIKKILNKKKKKKKMKISRNYQEEIFSKKELKK